MCLFRLYEQITGTGSLFLLLWLVCKVVCHFTDTDKQDVHVRVQWSSCRINTPAAGIHAHLLTIYMLYYIARKDRKVILFHVFYLSVDTGFNSIEILHIANSELKYSILLWNFLSPITEIFFNGNALMFKIFYNIKRYHTMTLQLMHMCINICIHIPLICSHN